MAFILALLGVLALTPMVRVLVVKLGAVDHPVERSIHRHPVPSLGGLGIAGAFVAAVVAVGGGIHSQTMAILVGCVVILLVGVVDDLFNTPPVFKLLGQAAAGYVLVLYGVKIDWLTNPYGGMFDPGWVGGPLTVMWVVAVVNTVNLIDGLDGLAAGISGIAALVLLAVSLLRGQVEVAILAAALAGASLGFLPYNFHRTLKIFMGDTGSMFLGFVIAAMAVEGTLKSTTAIALAVPILALGLPIFDTAFAILRRLINKKPIAEADRNHLHHRLLDAGFSQWRAVVILYLVSIALGLAGLSLVVSPAAWALVVGVVAVLGIGAYRLGVLELKDKGMSS